MKKTYIGFAVILIAALAGLTTLLVARIGTGPAVEPGDIVVLDDTVEYDHSLQARADSLLPLFGGMEPIPFYTIDEPVIHEGSNAERGVAYTVCEGRERPTVYVKKTYFESANRRMLINTLKHEMTHAWLCREGLMSGHDSLFRRKFESVGGAGN